MLSFSPGRIPPPHTLPGSNMVSNRSLSLNPNPLRQVLGKLQGWARVGENTLWKEIRSVCQGWVEPGGAPGYSYPRQSLERQIWGSSQPQEYILALSSEFLSPGVGRALISALVAGRVRWDWLSKVLCPFWEQLIPRTVQEPQRGLLGPVWEDRTCQAVPDTTTFLPTCLQGSMELRGRKWVFWG
jgi:hypothetical protein